MRNNATVSCDSIKISLKVYKDEFITHLNILAVSAHKKKKNHQNPMKALLLLAERDLDVIQ